MSGSIFAAYERYGRRFQAAMPAGTTPAWPSEVSTPAIARSNSSVCERRGRGRSVVETVQEPSSAGSVTSTPRVAPIASALRIVSGALAGAIESSVTSPSPAASMSLSAASRAYSSLPLIDGGHGGTIQTAVRTEPLTGGCRIRHRFREHDDAQQDVNLPEPVQPPLPSSARANTRRWICWVPS